MACYEIYCDGGCSPNPGNGAFAAIVQSKDGTIELCQAGYGSNNQMELRAAILGLDYTPKGSEVHVFSDSQYLYKGMVEYMPKWRSNSWKNSRGKEVENLSLWRQLVALSRYRKIYWHWIRGHSGHPQNERAHDLVQHKMQGTRNASNTFI